MRMPTLFAVAKILSVSVLAFVLAFHAPTIIKPFVNSSMQPVKTTTDIVVVQQGEQIVDLQRRIDVLERSNLPTQLAAMQTQQAIDHQILMAMSLMMFTLAVEAMWRLAAQRKTRSADDK